MTVENKLYSRNDLEHVKFTKDSTNLDSTVKVRTDSLIDEQKLQTQIIVACLTKIEDELMKMNAYLALMTEA